MERAESGLISLASKSSWSTSGACVACATADTDSDAIIGHLGHRRCASNFIRCGGVNCALTMTAIC
eukprot:2801974-Prymnesium_polylepis.1